MTASFLTIRRAASARGRYLAVGVLATLPFSASARPSTPAAPVVVRSVSAAPLPRGERITIELSGEARYTGDRLDRPDRIYFDFQDAGVGSQAVAAAQAVPASALVATVRIARHARDVTRVVLEVTGHPRYSVFPMYNPFRLVVDVESEGPPAEPPASSVPAIQPQAATASTPPARLPSAPAIEDATVPDPSASPAAADLSPAAPSSGRAPAVNTEAAEARPPAAESEPVRTPPAPPSPAAVLSRGGDYSLARQLGLGVARVVIDPGHGGHDPGAQANGIKEAELVLDVALRVEKLLQDQPGVDVVLTRRTDEFIALQERTAIANRQGADLFLSIHANASRRTIARGIETYFLNFATTPDAEAVAARENAASDGTMGKLPDLVKTITLNNKVIESRELATIVQTSMMRRLRQQNKTVRDLGVKQAPFVVLIGAQMPSVLAEISFVTNKAEAALLKDPGYRQRIAESLADAVLRYQASLKKASTVALRTP